MHPIKISVITVCYNAADTIERCIRSVLAQTHNNVEYILVDGASVDGTMMVVDRYRDKISIIVSEPDNGIYHAMNKGIALATGDIVGMLNADDVFADELVLKDIADAFLTKKTDCAYGDLHYMKPDGTILRKWVSGDFVPGMFESGWMPPHPTFYCRKEVYRAYGTYDEIYGSAADYELMLRVIHTHKASVSYVPRVLINMLVGGVSNNSYAERAKVLILDWKAMRKNGLRHSLKAVLLKRFRKVGQFF